MTTVDSAPNLALESETPSERAAFLAERKTGIGGSDAAAVVGLNPWQTNFALWEEKVGRREPDDLSHVAAVKWGIRLEDVVADAFAEETGLAVHRVNRTLRHPEYPWMMAHLDRRIVGQKRGLEVKTAGHWAAQSDQWGRSGTDEVPEQYLIQVMHYMAVTGYEAFSLAVLAGGQDFRIYTVPRNDTLIAQLIEREAAFWKLVESKTAPQVIDLNDARRLFPISRASEIDCMDRSDIFDAVLQLRDAKRTEKAAKKTIDALQGVICGYMGENDTLVRNGQRLLTWKTQSRGEYVVKASSFRVLRLAGDKDDAV